MTDNFKLIKEFIQSQSNGEFDHNEDSFYIVEIIGRVKDNARIIAGNHKFKTYYIKTIEDLNKYESEIKLLCDTLQMRAYISVNYKSMKQATLDTMAEYATRISRGDYNKPYSIFDSCAAKYVERSNQLWIIDVDKDIADKCKRSIDEQVEFFKKIIENKCKPNKPIVAVFPTKTGRHIVCHPFDKREFRIQCLNKQFFYDVNNPVTADSKFVDAYDLIKENSPTLLYENIH